METHQVKIIAGTRAVVVVDIHQVGSSCGFSVPKMDFKEHRLILNEFFEKKAACDEKGDRANGIERYVLTTPRQISRTRAVMIVFFWHKNITTR